MFTSGFQESDSPQVVIEEGTADVVEKLLDFAYTGMVDFNSDNIVDILTTASYLQIRTAIDACTRFLRDKMVDSEEADVGWGKGIIFQVKKN